jgi:hypothetical protein
MGKLTTLHINLIGVGTALVLALILFFVLIKPRNEQVETDRSALESTRSAGGTQQAVAGKQRELEETKQLVAQTQADWAINEAKYMPRNIRFGTTERLLSTYINEVIEWPTYFGGRLAAWYDAQRPAVSRLPGVEFPIPSFPTDPNAISQLQYIKFPQDRWQVQLEAKDFDSAMNHLERFNGMRQMGMPVIDSVALQGTSPNLYLTYTLALYIIPREAPPATDPRLTGTPGAAGGAGGGAAGGAPGGFGGAPMGPGGGPPGVSGAAGFGGASPGGGVPNRTTPSGISGPAARDKDG